MPTKLDAEDYLISESGNWNVADKYSKIKIMRPLALADYYIDIATYGYEDLVEELQNFNVPRDLIRYRALQRLINILIKLINNARFACRAAGTKEGIEEHKKDLEVLRDILPKLLMRSSNSIAKTSDLRISKPDLFEKVLRQVEEIQSQINEPLNKNDLIFTSKEEFDPKAAKKKIMEDAMTRG